MEPHIRLPSQLLLDMELLPYLLHRVPLPQLRHPTSLRTSRRTSRHTSRHSSRHTSTRALEPRASREEHSLYLAAIVEAWGAGLFTNHTLQVLLDV